MARLAGILAVMMAGLGGCVQSTEFSADSAAQAAPPRFKLMTYNVNWGAPAPETTIEAIRSSGADVVCLQETTKVWERKMRAELSSEYPYMHFRHHYLFEVAGLAVLSKMPVREQAYVQPVGGWFPALVVEADTPCGPVQVAQVHLHPGVPSQDGQQKVRLVRKEEIQSLLTHVAPGRATVIVGDFNEDERGLAVEYLLDRGFSSALADLPGVSTWRVPRFPADAVARFDHILFSRELACFGAAVIQGGGSDHLPVMADLGQSAATAVATPAP